MTTSTDRIERQILLKAPRSRVWRAVSNAEEFGNWFGVGFKGQTFAAGKNAQGNITYPGYEHLVMQIAIERLSLASLRRRYFLRLLAGAHDAGSVRAEGCW